MNAIIDSLAPGTVIQDTYKIEKPLGEGGMGATFAALNLVSQHKVAIKVISSSFADNSRAVELFKREANLLRSLQHDAVVRYETIFQDKEQRLYLVMEMLDGQPLSYYLGKGARLGSEDVLRLGLRLASALDSLSAAGAVHRDVAPDNIFVPDDDIQSAKLIDFGLASDTVGTEKSILGTDFAGKFSYCAPEQLGVIDAPVTGRTDGYSLGLVLMKTAGLPVPGEGKGMAAGSYRRDDIQISADGVSPALRYVLGELLRADPKDRPDQMVPLFEAALSGNFEPSPVSGAGKAKTTSGAKPNPSTSSAPTKTQKSRAPVFAIATVVLLSAVGGGGYWWASQNKGSSATGDAIEQGDIGAGALQADDPLAEIKALIASGGADNLNGALAALLAMGRDATASTDARIAALIMAAEMVDPETFDADASPFDAPNPGMARRFYQSAADLGSDTATAAANRLKE